MAKKATTPYWGFDIRTIDRSVRPQDDFYRYANGGWLRSAKIPKDESRWGSFNMLRYQTEQQVKKLVEGLPKKNPAGSDAQRVRDAYMSALDQKLRNKLGITPLLPLLKEVESVDSVEDMWALISSFHARGISSIWNAFVDGDAKNSDKYILTFWQGGLSLPDRDYYLLRKPEQSRIRDAYMQHIERLLKLAGIASSERKEMQRAIIDIETRLAKCSMSKEDTRQPEKTYNKVTLKGLLTLAPNIPWKRHLLAIGINAPAYVIGQPAFFKEVAIMSRTLPLADWKRYLSWHLINGAASALSEPFVKANFTFYGKVLTGQKSMRAPWRRALGATTGMVGESLGKLYISAHFPASSKKMMDELVSDLFIVFEDRIKALPWMSAATKKKALKKLSTMRRKIGFPSEWKGYKGLVIKSNDYFGNLRRSSEYEHKREMEKLRRGKVDREEWFMYPQTVNAYFSPNLNEIVFPAAILQWPFFDPKADMAINYAGIGSVIGHEITHGFDDQGCKFDHKGNLNNWWTPQDKAQFTKRASLLVRQANGVEVEPGVFINGELTLGENIADLGGLIIAYEAYQKYLAKHGRTTIEGLTSEERFFLGFAQMEREVARPEFKKLAALTDPHAESSWRINCPVSNFLPFYEHFKVEKDDKLYRPTPSRAAIW